MSKRRIFKKAINSLCEEMLIDCIAVAENAPHAAHEDVENIAESILMMNDEFIRRLSHVDKKNPRAYIRKLKEDLSAFALQIVDQIYHL
ncbi:MAG: hypothetical protein K6F94_05970 [Bacteroidaceae bacterium]|nr:hypothetical protein [Bacteroidaceae bacterium]